MPLRVGLMGFGTIGRHFFRCVYTRQDIQLAAISDIADHAALEYLLRFDTILGRFPDEVSIKEGHLYVAGRQIPMLSLRDPADVPWVEYDVDVVIEATARPRSRAELQGYLERGVGRVVLCVPPKDPPDITVVRGVNDDQLRPEHRIISNGSCTAHSAAPVLKILHQAFGVERAFLTTVHAYTNQQRLADVPAQDPRRGRAAAENIIPQETNAAQVVMELLPELAGRISGLSINVPVPNGSVVDLVCWHRRPVTRLAVNEVIRTAAATEHWRQILCYEDEPVVSSDVVRSPYSGTFDSQATVVLGERVSKTVTWYDVSWGYVNRLVDLLGHIMELDARGQAAAEDAASPAAATRKVES